MTSILKVDTLQDSGGNTMLSSNGTGTFTSNLPDNTPAFSVYKNSDQTLTNQTTTKISFQTEIFDTDNAFDNATNYRFIVPSNKSGKYLFNANLFLSLNTEQASQMIIMLYKNGSLLHKNQFQNGLNDMALQVMGLSYIDNSNVGDYYEIYGTLGGAAGGTFLAKATYSSFQGYKLIGA